MKHIPICLQGLLLFCAVLFSFSSCTKIRPDKPKVLVFTKTAGYHHASIPAGVAAIQQLAEAHNFEIDTTSNAAWFVEDSLKQYAAVVFLSTTGDVLNHYQEADFERYIQAGGGYVGIHAATDTEYEWGWYGRLAGGYFNLHPGMQDDFPGVQPGVLQVVNQQHEATQHLPAQWKMTDEFYSFNKLNPDVNVLMTIDEGSYKVGVSMEHHPMAWYHDYDGGRAFYTALGHTNENYQDEDFQKMLLGGIQYAIGDNEELDYSRARTPRVPEENRFTKTMLSTGEFFEPTEMTILPNLDVLVAQRRGEIMLYKQREGKLSQAGLLDVYFKTNTKGVNAEEGVLGIKADPNFEQNRWVYVFYSPADTSVNRLSRFKFENDKLNMASEQQILQFYSQREICCHTGGSIAFDKDGLLYLSTGDNSTPFNEPKQPHVNSGYAPLDDRQGHEQYDARRTSGNTNDLRGKILRIRVKDDGSYEIPEGNLYAPNTQKTRPEIYVQGNRNPYRLTVDQKNGYLYWGEVGPDANNDSLDTRGPRGYDEVNQARQAGNFGWPLFVGDNYAYRKYNYGTGEAGAPFNAAKPVNASRNNTGLQELPPAQPAFIWYPYAASPDFPQVGTGGRNAMAGPAYYTDLFPENTRLPEYYNNKLFIYDWVRGWVKAVSLQPNGDFDKMEPFMAGTKLNAPIDMEVGPDGKLYVLEYGSGWFSKNADSGLSRIDYNSGNRAPAIADVRVDRTSGALPFRVVANVEATDPEGDELLYVWHLGNGKTKGTKEPQLVYTFTEPGDYAISVTVRDSKNARTSSKPVAVYAGNEAPQVQLAVNGNKTFYFPGKPVAYTVSVTDKDDPAAAGNTAGVFVSADYVEGMDKAGASMGHQVMSEAMLGKSLVQTLDCKACHKQAEKSIGPAYQQVAQKYQNDPKAVPHLVNKIIKGGAGVWGENAMPAHPDLKKGEARQIVAWIQSLAGGGQTQKSLPAKGTVNPTLDKPMRDNGVLVLSASYTDQGGPGIKPLMGNTSVVLKSPVVGMANATNLSGYTLSEDKSAALVSATGNGFFALQAMDLTGITGVEIMFTTANTPQIGTTFEVRLGGPNGRKLGEATVSDNLQSSISAGAAGGVSSVNVKLAPVTDGRMQNLYFVSKSTSAGGAGKVSVRAVRFVGE